MTVMSIDNSCNCGSRAMAFSNTPISYFLTVNYIAQ
jgi:hypothetical protein